MKLILSFLVLFSANSFAQDQNVIFITWDGVRPEEFFSGKNDPDISKEPATFLSNFHNIYAREGIVLGDNNKGSTMVVSNDSIISLPAYFSMMNGVYTDFCHLNQRSVECLRNPFETLPERLIRKKGLDKSEVAIFASWDRIKDAAESEDNSLITNAGPVEFHDPKNPGAHDDINSKMRGLLTQWHFDNGERDDNTTFAHAMTYLTNNRPKFMWIYLVETDDYGHANRYRDYVRAIGENEQRLEVLMKKLEGMGEYGKNTSIVLTTDHGRGKGSMTWMHHGAFFKNSKKVWAYIRGPRTKGQGSLNNTHYSHLNLRPTMEKMLGLTPLRPENVIKEAF